MGQYETIITQHLPEEPLRVQAGVVRGQLECWVAFCLTSLALVS